MSTNALLAGLAQMIDDAGVGVWNPGSTYTADQVAVTVQTVPQAPDNLIVLSPRPISDDPLLNDSVLAVQVRFRGAANDPQTVQDRDDAVFNLFQGLQHQSIGGVTVVVIWRQGGGSLGQDQNQRWERASTYYIRTTNPTLYRTD